MATRPAHPGTRADRGGTADGVALAARIRTAHAALEHCLLCEHRCGANRRAGESAPCRLGAHTYCFRRSTSFAEPPDEVPALRLYVAGCSFRCRFCNTAPECFEPTLGERLEPARVAADLQAAVDAGVKSIRLLGGEPSLHVHTLLELAAATARPLPMVLETNAYMTPKTLDLLDGVMHTYLVDFKFGNNACARSLAGMSRYVEVVTRNLQYLAAGAALGVRHLLMPGHLECCFRPVVDWLTRNLPGSRFQLMTGYVPGWRAAADPALGRLNRATEVRAARAYLQECALDWKVDGDGNR